MSVPPVAPPGHALIATWISSWAVPLIVVLGLVLVPLLYPDGRLLSPRWRHCSPTSAGSAACLTVAVASGAIAAAP